MSDKLEEGNSDRHSNSNPGVHSVDDFLKDALEVMGASRKDHRKKTTGIPTGFPELDGMLGGLRPGSVTVVGGRPIGMALSAFLRNIMVSGALEWGFPALVFSEFKTKHVLARALVSRSDANFDPSDNEWTNDELTSLWNTAGQFENIPLYFGESNVGCFGNFRDQFVSAHERHGIELLMADGFRRIENDCECNREWTAHEMLKLLKREAEERNIAVLVTAPMNFIYHDRGFRPRLVDFEDITEYLRLVDAILMLYQPGGVGDSFDRKHVELRLELNKQGATGSIDLEYAPEKMELSTSEAGKSLLNE